MMTRSLGGAVAALIAMSGAALAQDAAGRGGMTACRTDLATFCQGVEAGGGRKIACLADNKSKLSPDCAGALAGRGERLAQATPPLASPAPGVTAPPPPLAQATRGKGRGGRMAACRTDLATFCADLPKGGGGRAKCLADNQSKLSPDCAATLQGSKDQRQQARAACKSDAKQFCQGQKGAERGICLRANQTKLSPACAAVVDALPGKRAGGAAAPKPQ